MDSDGSNTIDDAFDNIVDMDLLLEDITSIYKEEATWVSISIVITLVYPPDVQLLFLTTKYKMPANVFPFIRKWADQAHGSGYNFTKNQGI